MADRVATSDDTSAGGAPAEEALRGVRKARRELLAVLAPLVIAAAPVVVAAGSFLAGGGFSILIAIATAALPAAGMLAIFYTLSHGSTQNKKLHHPLALLFGINALFFAITWLLLAAGGTESGFPLGIVLITQIAAVFPSILLGFWLLSLRGKRYDVLFGEASSPLPSRRRVRAAAWMAVAGIAIALSLAVTILLAVVEVAAIRDNLPLRVPGDEASGRAYFLALDAARETAGIVRGVLIMSLYLIPNWLMILLVPLALLAGDTYQHRRRQAGLGPDRHLARAPWAILVTLAVIGFIAVPVLNWFLPLESILNSLLDWLGLDF